MSSLAISRPTTAPLTERRGDARHRCHRICHVRPNGTRLGVCWGVTLLNLSRRGALLELQRPLAVGEVLAVQPTSDLPAEPLLARVIRVVPWGERWLCGCVLVRPLQDDEMDSWLS